MKAIIKLKKIGSKVQSCTLVYFRNTTIHGLRNIGAENSTWQDSAFWLIVCSCGILMSIVMSGKIWQRFHESPTMTTVETNHYPVKNVPFPAVTFCNLNKIMKSSFYSMAKKFEEMGIDQSTMQKFVKEIPQIYSTRLPKFENEERISQAMKALGYTLESFLFDLSQPCSQFLIRCLWLGKEYDCAAMFDEVKTPEGFCCSFNFHGSKVVGYENISIRSVWMRDESLHWNEEEPLYVDDSSTLSSGLTVVVDVDEENYFASVDSFFGSLVILHDSMEYPDSNCVRASIQPRSEAMIGIRAHVIESSENVQLLTISQRQCYFSEEHSVGVGLGYSYEACSLDCKLFTYEKNCKCIPFFYPNNMNSSLCTLDEMKCIHDFRVPSSDDTETVRKDWSLRRDRHCKCLPSCNDCNYEWVVQTNEIRQEEYASPIFEGKLGNRSAISVFFEHNVCIKYRIESQITWDSVLASFGGIFGLCTGGSIISLIELFYYFSRELTRTEKLKRSQLTKSKKILTRKITLSREKIFSKKFENSNSKKCIKHIQVYPWIE